MSQKSESETYLLLVVDSGATGHGVGLLVEVEVDWNGLTGRGSRRWF